MPMSKPAIKARIKRLKGAMEALKYLEEEGLDDAAAIAFLKDLREDLEDAVFILEGQLEDYGKPSIPWEQVKAELSAAHPNEAEEDVEHRGVSA